MSEETPITEHDIFWELKKKCEKQDDEGFIKLFNQHPSIKTYRDPNWDSLLSYGAEYGCEKICRFLIEQSYDVNEIHNRNTAIGKAASKGQTHIVQLLIEHGAKVDEAEHSICSPLTSACIFKHFETAKILIENGANINRIHLRQHDLPLDKAIGWGSTDIAELLRSKGALSSYRPDWSNHKAKAILGHVFENAGRILPLKYPKVDNANIEQHLAIVNNSKNKYLFTTGLFEHHQPMLELFIVLPDHWNPLVKDDDNQFPVQLLHSLSNAIIQGMHIDEKTLIAKDDDRFNHLNWPENVDGFYPVDFEWPPIKKGVEKEKEKIPEEETVFLFTLLPVKKTKKGIVPPDVEKNRKAKWQKLCVKLPQQFEF